MSIQRNSSQADVCFLASESFSFDKKIYYASSVFKTGQYGNASMTSVVSKGFGALTQNIFSTYYFLLYC